MDFSFDETQEAIDGLAKQVFGDHVTDERLRQLEREGTWFHRAAWEQLARAELLALALPESSGGGGLGMVELGVLLHRAGRSAAPLPLIETLVAGALPIARFGGQGLKDQYLRGIAQGKTVLSAALSDGDSIDPLRPATVAERIAGGWRLRGTKTGVGYLDDSAAVVVPARLADDSSAVFVVPTDTKGLEGAEAVGTNGQPLHELRLDGAVVDEEARLGGDEGAGQVLSSLVDHVNAAISAFVLGLAEQALFMTAGYSGERVQFGQPIGAFQAVKQRVADMYIDLQCMKVTAWRALWRLANGMPSTREVAVARFWACEGGHRVVAGAQHIHGGMGFDRDYPLYRYFLATKQLEFTLGAAPAQLVNVR